jgi:hypothetical protein
LVAKALFRLSTFSVDNFVHKPPLTAENPDFMRAQTLCSTSMQLFALNKIKHLGWGTYADRWPQKIFFMGLTCRSFVNNYSSFRPKAFACAAFRVNFRCGNRALCRLSAEAVGLAIFLEKAASFLIRWSYAAIRPACALKVATGCGYLCEQGCSYGQACTKEKLARTDRRIFKQRKYSFESVA